MFKVLKDGLIVPHLFWKISLSQGNVLAILFRIGDTTNPKYTDYLNLNEPLNKNYNLFISRQD